MDKQAQWAAEKEEYHRRIEQFIREHDFIDEFMQREQQEPAAYRPGRYALFQCPAHDDSNASLSIFWDGRKWVMKCNAGCTFNGKRGIDVLGYLVWRTEKPAHEIVNEGVPETPRIIRKLEPVAPERQSDFSMSISTYESRFQNKFSRALPYLAKRGIDASTGKFFRLGYAPDFQFKAPYCSQYGELIERYACPRLVIPHITWGIRRIEFRLIEDEALSRLKLLKDTALYRAAAERNDSEEYLLEALFGNRYVTWGDAKGGIYNASDFAVLNDDRTFVSKHNPIGIIMEGCFNVWTVVQELKTPAAYAKGSPFLKAVTKNTEKLLFFRDPDSAGQGYAKQNMDDAGRTDGDIDALDGYKDINEMHTAGVLMDWAIENELAFAEAWPSYTRRYA
jgi:hypothetical protein